MRRLSIIVAVLATLYCGFWFVASAGLRRGVEAALSGLQAQGLADYGALSVAGFPSRLDLTVTGPALYHPQGLAAWTAPFLQVFALTYRPHHVIAVWPHDQRLLLPGQSLDLTSADMRASAVFTPGLALAWDHGTLIATGGRIASDRGWTAAFAEARAATRKAAEPLGHDIGIEVLGLDAPALAPQTGTFRLDGTLTLDRPIDRQSGTPRITSVALRQARLAFGLPALAAAGDLTVSPEGYPQGRLELTATRWREVLPVLAALGLIRAELLPTWEAMLGKLAEPSPDPDTVTLPLTFASGRISLGPFPLGPAPRLPGY